MRVLKPAVLWNNPLLRPFPDFATAVPGILTPFLSSDYFKLTQYNYFHTSVSAIQFWGKLTFHRNTDGRTRLSLKNHCHIKKKRFISEIIVISLVIALKKTTWQAVSFFILAPLPFCQLFVDVDWEVKWTWTGFVDFSFIHRFWLIVDFSKLIKILAILILCRE